MHFGANTALVTLYYNINSAREKVLFLNFGIFVRNIAIKMSDTAKWFLFLAIPIRSDYNTIVMCYARGEGIRGEMPCHRTNSKI